MSTLNKALARATQSVEMQVVLEQLAFNNKVEQLFQLDGDKYVPVKWEMIAHHKDGRHVTRLKADVENHNLYVRMGAGFKKTDVFALKKRRGPKGTTSIFSIRS